VNWLKKLLELIIPQIKAQAAEKIQGAEKVEHHAPVTYNFNIIIGNTTTSIPVTAAEAKTIDEQQDMDVAQILDLLYKKFPSLISKAHDLKVNVFDDAKAEDEVSVSYGGRTEDIDSELVKDVTTSAVAILSTPVGGTLDMSGEVKPKVTKDRKGSKRKPWFSLKGKGEIISYNDAEKIVESGKKAPLKTTLIIIVSLILLGVGTAVGTFFSETIKQTFFPTNEKQKALSITQQSTTGNQTIVIIDRSTIKDNKQVLDKLLEDTPKGKTYTEQELRSKIAEIYQQLYDTLPQDAEKRASQFLSTLPLRQKQISDQQKRQAEFIKSIPDNLNKTFKDIIQYIDSYVMKIEEESGMMKLEKVADIGPVIVSSNRMGRIVRIIHFTDSKFIKIAFSQGEIRDRKVREYPTLSFQGYLNKKPIENGEFKVWKMRGSGFGGGWGVQYEEDGTMSESTKEHFKKGFDKFLDRVIAAKS
jgi:hypothetical protein